MSDTKMAETGRKVVRVHLLDPLEAEGIKRFPKTSPEQHAEFVEKLLSRLSYMRPDNLEKLRTIVLGAAGGKHLDRWPSFATIWNYARTIQVPPDRSDEVLWSWLHSRAGVAARDNGNLVATYRFIKTRRRPPLVGGASGQRLSYDMRQIDEMARDMDRERNRIEVAQRRGEATDSQRQWLQGYYETEAACLAIVDAGLAHRRELEERETAA